jgi:hypothetical protein
VGIRAYKRYDLEFSRFPNFLAMYAAKLRPRSDYDQMGASNQLNHTNQAEYLPFDRTLWN